MISYMMARSARMALAMLIGFAPLPALAAQISVAPDIQQFNTGAGEAQSTVVPPGKKNQCMVGRFVATTDWVRPSTTDGVITNGVAHWRDLDGAHEGDSTIDTPPTAAMFTYGSNDHRLVVMPNGDLIYEIQAFTKQPLTPKPAWFDYTFRGDFGPGARTAMLVWRSTDCGGSFQFLSETDSAALAGRQCGNPQYLDPKNVTATHKFDMGGTDGPWLGYSMDAGLLVMSYRCVGYLAADNTPGAAWALGKAIDRTLVLTSPDGATWTEQASTPPSSWGAQVVMSAKPAPPIAMTMSVGLAIAHKSLGVGETLNYIFGPSASVSGATWGWDPTSYQLPSDNMHTWLWATNVATRVPGSPAFLLAFPNTLTPTTTVVVGGSGNLPLNKVPVKSVANGFRVFFYDATKTNATFDEIAPIVPTVSGPQSIIMHVTVADPGVGPLLLYWYDVNGVTKTATVRGRVIYGYGQASGDFDIRRVAGVPTPFTIVPKKGNAPYWYGDYNSASGYGLPKPKLALYGPTYKYYPFWVEPDGTVRFTEVTVTLPGPAIVAPTTIQSALKPIPVQVKPVLTLSPNERNSQTEHDHAPQLRRPAAR